MKKIKIEVQHLPSLVGCPEYKIVRVTNAAVVTFPACSEKKLTVGDCIPANNIDDFARDCRWDCVITTTAK